MVYLGFAAVIRTQHYRGVRRPSHDVSRCLVRRDGLLKRREYTSAAPVRATCAIYHACARTKHSTKNSGRAHIWRRAFQTLALLRPPLSSFGPARATGLHWSRPTRMRIQSEVGANVVVHENDAISYGTCGPVHVAILLHRLLVSSRPPL